MKSLIASILVLLLILWLHCIQFERFSPAGYGAAALNSFKPRQSTNSDFIPAIKSLIPFPKLEGTCDVYPLEAGPLIASGNDYFPRPNLQSYEAYSAKLARLDADHLKGDRAPDNIFFSISPGPNLPPMDDGLSWPELWTHYDLTTNTVPGWNYVVLRKSVIPRPFTKTLIGEVDVAFNQFINIPPGLIWAEIDFKKTAYGHLVDQLYKSPTIDLSLLNKDHIQKLGRIIPGPASAGFLLSPFIPDAQSFARVMGGDLLPANQLTMPVCFNINGDSACWKQSFHIRLYKIQL